MNFLVNGRHRGANPLVRAALGTGLAMLALFWVSSLLLFYEKMGLTPASVALYYLGDEESFRGPLSYMGLLETTHAHLFTYGLVFILVNHLVVFTAVSTRLKALLIWTTVISGALNVGAGWLVLYCGAAFAAVKLGAFIVFQASLGVSIVLTGLSLIGDERRR
ncbi:MAG TPA: hypothetical protein ENJ37_05775 [Deltaproteobacteria bacterium]|nr:hypothetical protein [Deltaproteobacteria bacterium]